ELPESGEYQLWTYYASAQPRPVNLYFDGRLILEGGLHCNTGGWSSRFLRWFKETPLFAEKGRHVLKLEARGLIPHLYSLAFLSGVNDNLDETPLSYEKVYLQPSPLKLLKDKLRDFGVLVSLFKFYRYISSSRLIDNYLDIVGIFHGTNAFKGPSHVQIDLTNDCNNNCIGCWCNSPLLEEKMLPPEAKRQTMPFGLVQEVLDELAFLGTKEIYFSGGGEPFMHPEIMEVLAYTKRKGFDCCVNTNFTLLNKEKVRQLIDIGVDHLNVSTWAGNPKTYAATHPNKSEETFLEMIENLKFINHTKRKKPHIKLYNVIFNMNYRELKEMIALAKETKSESVEFTLIDTMPGKTDKLLLDAQQIKELQASARQIARYTDSRGYFDGVLLFRFDSFLRRISSASDLSKATYDRNIIDKMPCYIGWCFSRVIPNGDVHACLKAHRIPTGNLFESSFRQIWNGAKQRHFRKKTQVCVKSDPFFRLIGNDPEIKEAGCYKSCDDIGRNTHIHNRIMSLTSPERSVLKLAARLKTSPVTSSESEKRTEDPLIRGIRDGRRAFCGPEQVVIDITNRCNLRCVGCWLYSPHLKNKPDSSFLNQEIDFSKANDLISGLAKLGTKRIRFTGGGEPFLYPKMMELIALAKEKGLITCVTTNFSLLDKQKIDELIRLGLDELAASLWAGNKETYQKLHPASPELLFEKIKENLLYLNRKKKERPFVTLCNVICNLNYDELKEMFDFAVDSQSDAVYFTLIDALEGSDTLLLDAEQRRRALEEAEKACSAWEKLPSSKRPKLDYFDGFIARLKEESACSGDYDRQRINKVPCYVGWTFARIVADGDVSCCCRGVKKPMGNINKQDFKEIWSSPKYNEFRTKAKYLPKTESYFSEIGCLKMCDNLMHNEEMHKRIRPLV
ncbi:MAG: radical SAM protein, partial [Candidatus Omnitrophica bacterium]|nr:radical SAM protein [Candidatus Omnitrophota bacterium]